MFFLVGLYTCHRVRLYWENMWEAFGILQSHIRQRAKCPELVLPRRNLSSGKQGLVGWHGRSLQGGHVSECFSVNRGMVINPTFLVGVYYLQKNNPRKDFPSWRVRWVYPRQYLGCVIFSVISVSGFYHGFQHQMFHHHVAEYFVGHSFVPTTLNKSSLSFVVLKLGRSTGGMKLLLLVASNTANVW